MTNATPVAANDQLLENAGGEVGGERALLLLILPQFSFYLSLAFSVLFF